MKTTWRDRARVRMKDLGKTQDDLRKPLGVDTRGSVGHYLTGRRQPDPDQIMALADELRCSLDWLLRGTGQIELPAARTGSLTEEAQRLAIAWQHLPETLRTQVFEFMQMQLRLMEQYPALFVRTKNEKEFYVTLQENRPLYAVTRVAKKNQ